MIPSFKIPVTETDVFIEEGIEPESTHNFINEKQPQQPPKQNKKVQFNKNSSHELSLDTHFNNEKTPLLQQVPPPVVDAETPPPLPPRPRIGAQALLKIPAQVIHDALGLAVFTTFRAGTWGASLAAGSGVLIARDPVTNAWSSPSAIGISTLGLGLLTGIDVADCVLVINTSEALERFKGTRLSLGAEVGITAGPWGAGGVADYALGKQLGRGRMDKRPTYTYVKTRGIYAGIQLDGTVIGVRADENAKFYGEKVEVADVLAGRVQRFTGLNRVLGEIDQTRRRSSVEVGVGLGTQVLRAPVLLEFEDRTGKRRGSGGDWVDVESGRGMGVEEYAVGVKTANETPDLKGKGLALDEEKKVEEAPSGESSRDVKDRETLPSYGDVDKQDRQEKQDHKVDSKDNDDGDWEQWHPDQMVDVEKQKVVYA